MGKKAFELGAGRRQKQPPLPRRANKQGSCQQPGPGAASSPRGSCRIGEKSRPSPSVSRQAWLSQGRAYGTGETQGKAAEGPGYLLPHRTTVLTSTAGLIKLGVNNGAEPPVSPAAVGALGGGGQTLFISEAGAGRVAKGKGLMGLHAFLHGGELGCCRRTNNFLADAPRATSNIEYSCSAAGHFSPHRPPPRSLSSRGYLPAEGPGRDVSPPACCTEPVRPEATGSRGAAKGWWMRAGRGSAAPTLHAPVGAMNYDHSLFSREPIFFRQPAATRRRGGSLWTALLIFGRKQLPPEISLTGRGAGRPPRPGPAALSRPSVPSLPY